MTSNDPVCTCKQYNTECDEHCNCCDSPYRQFECDCECKDRKNEAIAKQLAEIIKHREETRARLLAEKKAEKHGPFTRESVVHITEEDAAKLSGDPQPLKITVPVEIAEQDEINEETEYGQESDEPVTDLQRQFADALDKDSARRETTIHTGDGPPVLKIRRRTTPEILEYMADNVEKQADYYNQHQLIMLLRMVADQIKERKAMVPIRAQFDSPITAFGVRDAPDDDHWLIREKVRCPVCDDTFEGTQITMVLVGFRGEDWAEHRRSGKQWGNGGTVIVHAVCAGLTPSAHDIEAADDAA